MAVGNSPLRYPGGKQILTKVLAHLIELNGPKECVYVEPYAGGAGAALGLLFAGHVDRIVLNDADRSIFLFWRAILEDTPAFLKRLREVPLTIDEWRRQRAIYLKPANRSDLAVGFATFFLNRCNRSGIISTGGPIGGIQQRGKWKLDARFNREELAKRIEKVHLYRHKIKVHNLDALTFLRKKILGTQLAQSAFVYLDPPYFRKSQELYLNCYTPAGHARLAKFVRAQSELAWVMTYDNSPEIKKLYSDLRQLRFNLGYSAREVRTGKELLIVQNGVTLPRSWHKSIPSRFISAAAGWIAP